MEGLLSTGPTPSIFYEIIPKYLNVHKINKHRQSQTERSLQQNTVKGYVIIFIWSISYSIF